MIAIVVAYGQNRGIGYRGQLPWRLPGDLRRFRELTIGGSVLMGRKTYESLPARYRPLPGRRNVVVSANPRFDPARGTSAQRSDAGEGNGERSDADQRSAKRSDAGEGTSVELHRDVEAALQACGADCYVIGGGSVYEQLLPLAQRVYATEVRDRPLSDTWFPELPGDQWRRSEQTDAIWENGTSYRFAIYDRLR